MSADHDDAIDSHPPLDDTGLARLDELLAPEQLGEEAPDVISAHGFLVALAVAPQSPPQTQWLAELFETAPAFAELAARDEVITLMETLTRQAGDILERGEWLELPFDTDLDDDGEMAAAIEDWCAGFMQAVFLDETTWFAQDESHVAALLLPFMALSGLFEEEPEMAEMVADEAQFSALATQLPELTLDLYLHFRVPPEAPKRGPGKSGGKHEGKSRSGARKGSARQRGGKR
ncbi:YecA family protein [Salinicola endophyticus]|uniref:YecA family protein n=1 Tax=Salinicola endophyticus TaxID=1949083 RepID=A0ABY8FBN2_9GAMM|nr:YecA family protein [Salinicola endophyticus]WFF40213.1 YecA family protein [Salinicola endophyticus]